MYYLRYHFSLFTICRRRILIGDIVQRIAELVRKASTVQYGDAFDTLFHRFVCRSGDNPVRAVTTSLGVSITQRLTPHPRRTNDVTNAVERFVCASLRLMGRFRSIVPRLRGGCIEFRRRRQFWRRQLRQWGFAGPMEVHPHPQWRL